MAINNYDDFIKVYDKPTLDGLIVGFSGIDPQKKKGDGDGCDCDNTKLTEEQQAIVDGQILEHIRNLEIRVDCGNVNPDDDDDDYVLPGYLDPTEIDHEKLKNLYGGGPNGHYHLSKEERDKLIAYPSYSNLSLNISQNIQHEKLLGLLGGNDNGHFHLTRTELSKLQGYPEFGNLGNSLSVNHEKISGLLGGNSDGHYHMTEDERANLLKIIAALFPNGASEPVLPSDIENKLRRETWTFVLEDDTTYQRDVAIWN